MNDQILNEFIKDFPINGTKKEKPYVILFDAYTGMGKSTVARIIAKYDNSVILNNDEVRLWLQEHNQPTNLKDDLQNYRLEELIKNKISCIHDSCFCHNWEKKKQYYDNNNIKYYIIKIKCREETVKERLSTRTVDGINFSKATFDDYLWMKENVNHVPEELITYTIDTEDDIEKQVLDFISQNKLDN